MSDSSPIAQNTVLKLTLPWVEIQPAYEKATRQLTKQVKTDGFRKGKVPAGLAKQMVGHAHIAEHALDQLLPKAYADLIAKEQKAPLTHPDITPEKIEVGEDWVLKIEIAERPTIELGKYQATVKTALKKAQTDLEKTPEAPAETTPESDSQPTKTKPKIAAKPTAPALTEAQRKDALLQAACATLVTQLQPSIPELLVRAETRRDLEQLAKTLEQLKMTVDDYLARRQMDFKQLSGELAATALARLQLEFILQAIRDEAKITTTPEEIQARIEKIEDPAVRAEYSQNHEYTHYLESVISREKTLDYLLTLAK